jgi:hypothetical protein
LWLAAVELAQVVVGVAAQAVRLGALLVVLLVVLLGQMVVVVPAVAEPLLARGLWPGVSPARGLGPLGGGRLRTAP